MTAPPQHIFHLEGAEDLTILDGTKRPLEFIQVKSYSDPLGLATLEPKREKKSKSRRQPTLFRRILQRAGQYPDVKQRIVSFGPFTKELLAAWKNDGKERKAITEGLLERFYSEPEARKLFESLELKSTQETDLEEQVLRVMTETISGGEPEHAFEMISYWLHRLSEESSYVTRQTVIEKLTSIGKYLAERSTYHSEWFTSISPVEVESNLEGDKSILQEEFYQITVELHETAEGSRVMLVHDRFPGKTTTYRPPDRSRRRRRLHHVRHLYLALSSLQPRTRSRMSSCRSAPRSRLRLGSTRARRARWRTPEPR